MLNLTPELMEATYELLRLTPPFKAWKLPEADAVAFHVIGSVHQADHCMVGDMHQIRISANKHKTLRALTETMAHEMIHCHEAQLKLRSDVAHGAKFQRFADRVCKIHGFDRGQF